MNNETNSDKIKRICSRPDAPLTSSDDIMAYLNHLRSPNKEEVVEVIEPERPLGMFKIILLSAVVLASLLALIVAL